MKFTTILSLAIISMILITAAACNSSKGVQPVNKNADGVALKGYDTVAYFSRQKAVEGKAEHEFVWNGAKWLFSSAENRDEFAKSPEKYAPQYGGFCSWAVSHGYTANGDPEAWKVVDGKLYLNYDPKVKEMWEKEQTDLIKKGDENWRDFQTRQPEHKGLKIK